MLKKAQGEFFSGGVSSYAGTSRRPRAKRNEMRRRSRARPVASDVVGTKDGGVWTRSVEEAYGARVKLPFTHLLETRWARRCCVN